MFENEIYNIIVNSKNGIRRRSIADRANIWVADNRLTDALQNLLALKKVRTSLVRDAANMECYLLYHANEIV